MTGPGRQHSFAGADLHIEPPFDAVVFDLDGVVTDTAALHARAWKRLFDEVLADPRAGLAEPAPPFDLAADYRRHVDGRSREDGVQAFLAARGVVLPPGAEDDAPDAWTVHGLAARKNRLFLDLLATEGVHVFPGTVDLLDRLRAAGTPIGLVTASRNADALLATTGLADAFDVVVDGVVAARLGLPGKPDPAVFLEAARRLGVTPARTAVVEDAVSGVTAARRGGFGLVVGIDRALQRRDLELAGADLVLDDVAELDLGARRADPWVLEYRGFDPAKQTHREALTTLGNGYLATRGAKPERVDDGVHYPGTYLAGVYDRLTSHVDGQERVDEELVNAPSWLPFDVAVEDGDWWSGGGLRDEDEHVELDLRRGVLTRTARLVDAEGRTLQLVQRRVVSMDRPHLAAMETTLVPSGWSGRLRVRSGVDIGVVNANVAENHLLEHRHLVPLSVEHLDRTVLAEVRTTTSGIRIATAVRTTVVAGATAGPPRPDDLPLRPALRYDLDVHDGDAAVILKRVGVATSRDRAISSPREGALAVLERSEESFEEILRRHTFAWQRLWERLAVTVDTDDPVQLPLNLHVFHILQSVSPHTAALDAGVPARGLHGEGYRGHVFWDELFVLPLFVMSVPHVARALLDYRWRRLDAARHAARLEGYRGAMFPWQSGSDGREETPRTLFNPRSQRWIADRSHLQRHVGLAVAYDAWQYLQATGDTSWFAERGGELVLEVARHFSDRATFDARDGRFHIEGVMGPDEFHDGYPDAPGQGLRDNAYTNVLTAWVCGRAVATLALLPPHESEELAVRLDVRPEEVSRWRRLATGLAVPFHDGVLSQFAGYGDLLELDWEHYRRRYGNIERLELILEAEGDSANRYRLSKQADAVMLLYLLGPGELLRVLADLGHTLTLADLRRTVDYYLARSTHGSTLSRVVHTSVLAMLDQGRAWSEFREALDADLDDTQGGTTGHGIHLGAMAGTVDVVLRTFTGIRVERDALTFRPRPPEELRAVSFELRYRGQRIKVTLDRTSLHLAVQPSDEAPVRVVVDGVTAVLAGGQWQAFPVRAAQADRG